MHDHIKREPWLRSVTIEYKEPNGLLALLSFTQVSYLVLHFVCYKVEVKYNAYGKGYVLKVLYKREKVFS